MTARTGVQQPAGHPGPHGTPRRPFAGLLGDEHLREGAPRHLETLLGEGGCRNLFLIMCVNSRLNLEMDGGVDRRVVVTEWPFCFCAQPRAPHEREVLVDHKKKEKLQAICRVVGRAAESDQRVSHGPLPKPHGPTWGMSRPTLCGACLWRPARSPASRPWSAPTTPRSWRTG